MPSESFTYRPDLRHAALGLMSMKTSIPYNFRHKFRVRPLFWPLPAAFRLVGHSGLAFYQQLLMLVRNGVSFSVEKAAQTSGFPALCSSPLAG